VQANARVSRVARAIALAAVLLAGPASAQSRFAKTGELAIPEAAQGVAVDAGHIYAVDDRAIGKYTKDGVPVARWQAAGGGFVHLDSAVVVGDRVYCAHSNYRSLPMTSSVEVFDAATLAHVDSHSFGIRPGSLTWIDHHDGAFWGVFAGYDRAARLPDGSDAPVPYGGRDATTLVRFGPDWQVQESWIFPPALLERFGDMSNSGGSWGPDGSLYLTGHDLPEIYRVRLPAAGSVLELAEILPAGIRGQGIAWDRSQPGVLYGVIRATRAERDAGAPHRVVVLRADLPVAGR
jgi:hypothetical protein